MFHLVRPPGANPSYVPWLPSHLFGVVLNFSLGLELKCAPVDLTTDELISYRKMMSCGNSIWTYS